MRLRVVCILSPFSDPTTDARRGRRGRWSGRHSWRPRRPVLVPPPQGPPPPPPRSATAFTQFAEFLLSPREAERERVGRGPARRCSRRSVGPAGPALLRGDSAKAEGPAPPSPNPLPLSLRSGERRIAREVEGASRGCSASVGRRAKCVGGFTSGVFQISGPRAAPPAKQPPLSPGGKFALAFAPLKAGPQGRRSSGAPPARALTGAKARAPICHGLQGALAFDMVGLDYQGL
jgi:hypothetical protein